MTRSGGFAGLVRRAEVDSADHPAVAGLINDVRLDEVPELRRLPDRYIYDIQIGDRSAKVGEADLAGPAARARRPRHDARRLTWRRPPPERRPAPHAQRVARLTADSTAFSEAVTVLASMPAPHSTRSPTWHST